MSLFPIRGPIDYGSDVIVYSIISGKLYTLNTDKDGKLMLDSNILGLKSPYVFRLAQGPDGSIKLQGSKGGISYDKNNYAEIAVVGTSLFLSQNTYSSWNDRLLSGIFYEVRIPNISIATGDMRTSEFSDMKTLTSSTESELLNSLRFRDNSSLMTPGGTLNFTYGSIDNTGTKDQTGSTTRIILTSSGFYTAYNKSTNKVTTISDPYTTIMTLYCSLNGKGTKTCENLITNGWTNKPDTVDGFQYQYCPTGTYCSGNCKSGCEQYYKNCSYDKVSSTYSCNYDPNFLYTVGGIVISAVFIVALIIYRVYSR